MESIYSRVEIAAVSEENRYSRSAVRPRGVVDQRVLLAVKGTPVHAVEFAEIRCPFECHCHMMPVTAEPPASE